MNKTYFANTKVGTFYIIYRNEQWHPMFEGETLGGYHSPQHALDDLVGGHTFSPPGEHDTSELGLPDEIDDWGVR